MPVHSHDIVYVLLVFIAWRFAKLNSDLDMLTYIYLNVDDCWLTSSMPQQRFNIQMFLNYAVIPENVISED